MALAATAAKLLRDKKYKSLKKQSIASSGIQPVAKVLQIAKLFRVFHDDR